MSVASVSPEVVGQDGRTVQNKRLKIAVFNRVFSTAGGGAERYSVALVEQLAQRHDMHVFAQEIEYAWPHVHYHRVARPLRKPRWLNQLWFALATWWLTRRGFDVVHSHENTWHGQVQTAHVLPVKYTLFHGLQGWLLAARCAKVLTSPRLLVYLALEALRYRVRPQRRVVATSNTLQAVLAASYPASAAITSVITPGIVMPQASGSADARAKAQQQARAMLGLPTQPFCLLFVANDYRKKGLQALLLALAHLPAEVVLAVVGKAEQAPLFKAKAEQMGLMERVFFVGPLANMDAAYQAADCLVHPTLQDTFAMVVLEAMAHGLPVVVSNEHYCGIAGLLAHEVNALILQQPQQAPEIAQAVQRIFGDGVLKAYLSKQAVAFAQRYAWSRMAALQENLYFESIR